jgi:hypothetical protein
MMEERAGRGSNKSFNGVSNELNIYYINKKGYN